MIAPMVVGILVPTAAAKGSTIGVITAGNAHMPLVTRPQHCNGQKPRLPAAALRALMSGRHCINYKWAYCLVDSISQWRLARSALPSRHLAFRRSRCPESDQTIGSEMENKIRTHYDSADYSVQISSINSVITTTVRNWRQKIPNFDFSSVSTKFLVEFLIRTKVLFSSSRSFQAFFIGPNRGSIPKGKSKHKSSINIHGIARYSKLPFP